MAKKIVAILLILVAAIVLAVGAASAFMLFDTRGADNEQVVLRDFQRAEEFVRDYQARQKRLPSDADLDAWAEQMPLDYARIGGLLQIRPAPLHSCNDKDSFESSPGDRFALLVWRGEFFDCYASPSKKNTLMLTRADWLKNNFKAFGLFSAALLAIGAALLYGGIRLFRWRHKQGESYAASSS